MFGSLVANRLLCKAMEDIPQLHEVDYTLVSGDFNATGDQVKTALVELSPVLLWSLDKKSTTQKGFQRDNVAFSQGLQVKEEKVLDKQRILSHHPLVATLTEKE